MVNATLRPLYPRERPGTHCTEGWVGPRVGLDGCGKKKSPDTARIRCPDLPARSESLYRLSYRDPPHKINTAKNMGFRILKSNRHVKRVGGGRGFK